MNAQAELSPEAPLYTVNTARHQLIEDFSRHYKSLVEQKNIGSPEQLAEIGTESFQRILPTSEDFNIFYQDNYEKLLGKINNIQDDDGDLDLGTIGADILKHMVKVHDEKGSAEQDRFINETSENFWSLIDNPNWIRNKTLISTALDDTSIQPQLWIPKLLELGRKALVTRLSQRSGSSAQEASVFNENYNTTVESFGRFLLDLDEVLAQREPELAQEVVSPLLKDFTLRKDIDGKIEENPRGDMEVFFNNVLSGQDVNPEAHNHNETSVLNTISRSNMDVSLANLRAIRELVLGIGELRTVPVKKHRRLFEEPSEDEMRTRLTEVDNMALAIQRLDNPELRRSLAGKLALYTATYLHRQSPFLHANGRAIQNFAHLVMKRCGVGDYLTSALEPESEYLQKGHVDKLLYAISGKKGARNYKGTLLTFFSELLFLRGAMPVTDLTNKMFLREIKAKTRSSKMVTAGV